MGLPIIGTPVTQEATHIITLITPTVTIATTTTETPPIPEIQEIITPDVQAVMDHLVVVASAVATEAPAVAAEVVVAVDNDTNIELT